MVCFTPQADQDVWTGYVDYWGSDNASIAVAITLGALTYALVLPLKASPERLEQRAAG